MRAVEPSGAARALAAFAAEDPIELSLSEGEPLIILPEAAPEGWLLGQNALGEQGLVPESYIALDESQIESRASSDDAIRDHEDGLLERTMFDDAVSIGEGRMLADFTAEFDVEMTCTCGEVLTLLCK